MQYQNRVDPSGQLCFAREMGALMGNRGILHDATSKKVVAQWRRKAWVACSLDFKGVKRTVFGAHTYSELFFLDERQPHSRPDIALATIAAGRDCSNSKRPG